MLTCTLWDEARRLRVIFCSSKSNSRLTAIVNELLLDFSNSVLCTHKPDALRLRSSPCVVWREQKPSNGIQLCETERLPWDREPRKNRAQHTVALRAVCTLRSGRVHAVRAALAQRISPGGSPCWMSLSMCKTFNAAPQSGPRAG